MEKNEPLTQLGCDLSLRCPGYALLRYEPQTRTVLLTGKGHIPTRDPKTPHGAMLLRSYTVLSAAMQSADILVREKAFSRFARETQAICKMVGVADMAAWTSGQRIFHEFAPTTVKKLLTGSGKATKEEVAAALIQYVGAHEYASDDESDAAAVGIAWLIQNDYLDGGIL